MHLFERKPLAVEPPEQSAAALRPQVQGQVIARVRHRALRPLRLGPRIPGQSPPLAPARRPIIIRSPAARGNAGEPRAAWTSPLRVDTITSDTCHRMATVESLMIRRPLPIRRAIWGL